MGVCRSERVRPRLAALALAGLLIGQTLAPCGILLSSVHAAELRVAKQSSIARQPPIAAPQIAQIPVWAKDLEKRAAQQQREQKTRLAQWERPRENENNGDGAPSGDLDCLDCEVDLNPLDLADVPTEKALRRAGGLDGALYPMRRAEPRELGLKLDRLLKRVGIEGGLRSELPAKDPRFATLKRAQQRHERARAINMLFGRAVKKWRQGDRAAATELFGQYMKQYPKTPWSGEALLHLGYEAKEGGRLADALEIFQTIQDKTSEKPNQKLRAKKRQNKMRGVEATETEREADVDEALAGGISVEEAVAKLDSSEASDDDDESFEIHMKAKQQLADIDMAMGHYNDAADKMRQIMQEDTDWHRRVWARNQLQRSNILKHSNATQMACGPQSLKMVMVGLDKNAAAKKMDSLVAPRIQGFSMAELQTLAAKNGVAMRGFRSETNQLSQLALPAILHYNFGRDSGASNRATGHFVVLQGVDAKSRKVRIFDPLNKKSLRLSFAQLKRQWSGQGLENAAKNVPLVAQPLDAQSMKNAVGSSTTFSTDHDLGYTGNNVSIGVGDGVTAPSVQINQASYNIYAQQTLLSYQPARGPSVDISAIYNSGLANSVGLSSLGAKWNLNYSSTAFSKNGNNPAAEFLDIRMPDGSQLRYAKRWINQQYTSLLYGVDGNFNTVEKTSSTEMVLTFPDGNKWTYTRHLGTDSEFSLSLTKMTDARGLSLTLNYLTDSSGKQRLSSIVDAEGRATNFTWYTGTPYQVCAIHTITDPFGLQEVYTNHYSLLKVITDVLGQQFKFEYDVDRYGAINGDLASVETPKITPSQLPWQIKREYSGPYTSLIITNPVGDKEGFTSDSNNGLFFHVTPKRYIAPFNHNSSWQTHRGFGISVTGESVPTRIKYADGTYTTYSFGNTYGLLSQIVNRQGQITKFSYNAKGQLLKTTDPKNIETSIEYAANGFDPIRFIQPKPDGNGTVVAKTVVYNAFHQPTSITDVGGTSTFEYNSFGSLLTATDPQQRVTRNIYSAAGSLISVENSDRPTTGSFNWVKAADFTYDSIGRVQTVTDAANLTTGYEYNNLDQITATIHPDPDPNKRREEVLYLNGHLPIRMKDRFGRYSYTEYDELERARKSYVQDAQNNIAVGTTLTDYDKNGNLTRLTDTSGNITQWSYDTLDRAIGKQYQDGVSESYNYEYQATNTNPILLSGLLSSTTGTRGQTTYYWYDENGNQTVINYPNTLDVTMSYNALNDVSVITDGIGRHEMNYDDYGRLISNDGPLAADTQTYEYDELQRIKTQKVELGSFNSVHIQHYTYDALGRLSNLYASSTGMTTYSYDGNTDRLKVLTHPNGTKSSLSYDAIGRLSYVFNGANGNAFHNRYAYQYDARDVKTVMQTRTGDNSVPIQTTNYTYDALDQLKQERVTGGVAGTPYTTNYNYDAMGNRTQVNSVGINADGSARNTSTASTPNALNQVTSRSTATNGINSGNDQLYHDNAGNLVGRVTAQTSPSGVSTSIHTYYAYDDADRLVAVQRNDAAGQLLTLSEFAYDYASRRALTREYDFANGGWATGKTTRRVFDGLDVIQERDVNNSINAQIVRDGNIGGILSRTTNAGAAFYGYDGNGNVTLLTDASGTDVGHYRYDAFGNTLEAAGPRASENPYRFSTKEWHGPSGLYDYGLRFYSPSLGRWINRDPLQEEGGVNLYAMVGNNPVNNVDAYGLTWLDDLVNGGQKWVNDQLFGQPKPQTTSDEAGADDYAAAQNVASTIDHGRKTAAKATAYATEGYMAVMPFPGPKGVGSLSRAASSSSRILSIGSKGGHSQLFYKWKHAAAFGIRGGPTAKNLALYSRTLNRFINSPETKVIVGTYRRSPVIHYVNPRMGVNLMTKYSGEFISAYRLNPDQVINLLMRGKL